MVAQLQLALVLVSVLVDRCGDEPRLIEIRAADVVVRNLVLRNVGTSYVEDRAAIRADKANRCRIENNRIVGRLKSTGIRPKFIERFEQHNIYLPPNIFGFRDSLF